MREKLRIILFPNDFDISTNSSLAAFAFSTPEKVFINKTDDFYHINYRFNDYLQLDLVKLAKILTNMFSKNMPGVTFDLMVICEIDKLRRISELQRAFLANSNNIAVVNPSFKLSDIDPDDDFDSDDTDDDDDVDYIDPDDLDDDDDDDDEDVDDTVDTIHKILGMGGDMDSGSPFGDYKDHHKKNKDGGHKKSYSSSRILKGAKHPKRDIKRHGIIIESGKPRDRDEEIIKSFLRDFIPGDSNWIKSYRKTVLKRWLNQYSITKKAAKKLTKRHGELAAGDNKKGKKNMSVENVSKATRNILKHYNSFYDTSK